MKMKSQVIVLLAALSMFSCLADDSADNTDSRDPYAWCGYERDSTAEVDKFRHPDGYGSLDSQTRCYEGEDWDSPCYIPHDRSVLVKVASDGQDNAWLKLLRSERTAWRATMNNLGWTVVETTSALAEVRIRTFDYGPNGENAAAHFSTYTDFDSELGTWREFEKCEVIIYRKTMEEEDNTYRFELTPEQQAVYLRQHVNHELHHCGGLSHCDVNDPACADKLMGYPDQIPGPWVNGHLSATTEERSWIQLYRPH